MVESRHKRGPFDARYPSKPRAAARTWKLEPERDGHARLEWSAFLQLFFPSRTRHDFEAIATYIAYGRAHERAALEQETAVR